MNVSTPRPATCCRELVGSLRLSYDALHVLSRVAKFAHIVAPVTCNLMPGLFPNRTVQLHQKLPDYPATSNFPDYPATRNLPDYPANTNFPDYLVNTNFPDYPADTNFPDYPANTNFLDYSTTTRYPAKAHS